MQHIMIDLEMNKIEKQWQRQEQAVQRTDRDRSRTNG